MYISCFLKRPGRRNINAFTSITFIWGEIYEFCHRTLIQTFREKGGPAGHHLHLSGGQNLRSPGQKRSGQDYPVQLYQPGYPGGRRSLFPGDGRRQAGDWAGGYRLCALHAHGAGIPHRKGISEIFPGYKWEKHSQPQIPGGILWLHEHRPGG